MKGIWKIICGMGAILLLSSFKIIGGIESGPEALWGFKLSKSFLMLGLEISILA